MQKSSILGWRQGLYKMSLKCSVVPEMKEVLKKKKKPESHRDGDTAKGSRGQLQKLPTVKLEEFEQQNK